MARSEQTKPLNAGAGDIGHVQIASDVLARIAGIAALDVEGVSALAQSLDRSAVSKVSRNTLTKGVKVALSGLDATVDLNVTVGYGFSIPDVCREIQEKVAVTLNNMTGLQAACVNVRIAGVSMQE